MHCLILTCKVLSRNPSYERSFIISIIPLEFISVMHSACALLTVNALSGMQLQVELSSMAVIGQSERRSAFTSDHCNVHWSWVFGWVLEMQLALQLKV